MSRLLSVMLVLSLFSYGQLKGQSSSGIQEMNEEGQYIKKELASVNSVYAEARPLISDDGNTLYFSRRYHGGNYKGENDFQDVWVSHRDSLTDSWSEPQNLGKDINNKKSNAIASISPDGAEGIFFNTYRKTKKMPLVRSRQKANGSKWTKPEALEIENYVNVSDYADFYLAYKEKVLFLAIEGDTGVGEQDLFVAFANGKGGWKEPVNLGEIINTQKSEFAPFLAADGRSLFFCSSGHEGFGGSDIFMTVRLDDTWLKWSDPVNLGPSINTKNEETYFSIPSDFRYIYYTSHHPRDKNRNILRTALPEDFAAINGPVLVQLDSAAIAKIMLSGNYTVNLQGRTTNVEGIAFNGWPQNESLPATEGAGIAESGQEEESNLAAAIALNDSILTEIAGSKEAVAYAMEAGEQSGVGLTNVSTGLRNDFVGSKPANILSPAAGEMKSYLEKKLTDTELEVGLVGRVVEFKLAKNLMYEFNSIFVTTDYIPRLTQMARVLQERPELELRLVGFTDNIGSDEVNKRVARQRVEQLVYFFKARGIDASRIEIKAGGKSNPLAPNEKEDGRAKNRRVESTLKFQE